MGRMDDGTPATPVALPVVRLSSAGQTYVAVVALLAALSTLADGRVWYVALVVLTLPLTPVALWVGFYAAVAVGAAVGSGPEAHSWLVSLVWVLVWSLTAWLNARMVEKVLLRGWAGRWVERTAAEDRAELDRQASCRQRLACAPGRSPVTSQAVKNPSRSSPDTCSASAWNSSVVPLPPSRSATQVRRMVQNADSPTRCRSAWSVIEPRVYTGHAKMFFGPGSPIGSIQYGSSWGNASHVCSSHFCASWPSCASAYAASMKLAKPSLSQMSRQPCTATESPNHWCASSCTTVFRPMPAEYVGLVWFSREKPGWRLVVRPPVWPNG